MYKDKHGITKITDRIYDNLMISWDTSYEGGESRIAMLLYTPTMNNTKEHYHIDLDKDDARVLRDGLNDYLIEKKE